MAKALRKTNPALLALIEDLRRVARENEAPIWRDVAKRLSKTSQRWAEVNLSRLERYASEGETVLVPGKLLGAGELSKPLTVAAFRASAAAKEKVQAAGGKVLTISELMQQNPKGSGIRIMG